MNSYEKEGIVIFEPGESIDTLTSAAIQDQVLAAVNDGKTKIIIDCKGVNYISSMGLRVFLVAQKQLKPKGGEVIIVNLKDMLKEIFDIAGFSALFSFSTNLEEAMTQFDEDDDELL